MAVKAAKRAKTLILGIGNPILSDDAVGIRIAQSIKKEKAGLEVIESTEAGMAILEHIDGYDKLVIIDSIKTGQGKPGELYRLALEDLNPATGFTSSHGLDIATAFKLGEKVGYNMPKSVSIFAVEVEDNTTFSEKCTEELEKRIPQIARDIIREEKL